MAHVPDMKTQVKLFQVRQRAGREELERRGSMNRRLEADQHHQAAMEEEEQAEEARQQQALATPENLGNAQRALVQMVRNNAALFRTIEHLKKSWGAQHPAGQEAAEEEVSQIVEHYMSEVENDSNFANTAQHWSRERIKQGTPVSREKMKRKPGA